jgi:hypothetical protein
MALSAQNPLPSACACNSSSQVLPLLYALLTPPLAQVGSKLALVLCGLACSCCVWCLAARHSNAAATSCYHWQLSSQHKLLLLLLLAATAAHVYTALCSCGCCCSCAVTFQQQQQQHLKAPALHAVLLRHPWVRHLMQLVLQQQQQQQQQQQRQRYQQDSTSSSSSYWVKVLLQHPTWPLLLHCTMSPSNWYQLGQDRFCRV